MPFLLTEWNIKPRSICCQATGREFLDKEIFYTVLKEIPEGYERMDLCQEAWKSLSDDARGIFFWRSAFRPDPDPEQEAVAHDDAEAELRRLLQSSPPENPRLCFVLALLLERKRVLKARERLDRDGRKIVIYEHSRTQETFLVEQVEIGLEEIELLKPDLAVSPIFAEIGAMESAPAE
jgi:hypothetical protein